MLIVRYKYAVCLSPPIVVISIAKIRNFWRKCKYFSLNFWSFLVLLVLVGEVPALHICDVVADGFGHDGVEVGIAAEELR